MPSRGHLSATSVLRLRRRAAALHGDCADLRRMALAQQEWTQQQLRFAGRALTAAMGTAASGPPCPLVPHVPPARLLVVVHRARPS